LVQYQSRYPDIDGNSLVWNVGKSTRRYDKFPEDRHI
jgi:hypothetical protein